MTRAAADSLSRIPLAQLLADNASWTLKERLELLRRIARDLQTLHCSGRIHRSVGIDDVTVDEAFRPTLPEPPASRHLGGEDSDPEFCPPELTGGTGVALPAEIDAAAKALEAAGYTIDPRRIDVYQLGTLMCQLVTGQPVLCYIYDATIKARAPAVARTMLERTLGVDSTDRFQTCEQLIEALDAALLQEEKKGTVSACRNGPEGAVQKWGASPELHDAREADTSSHETPAHGSFIVLDGDTPPEGTNAADKPSGGDPLPFVRLGHYRIISQIGRGGMGDVYRGYDETLQRDVAIKVLPAQLARDADFVRRFRAEATAAASIAHPNVVPIYFIGEDAGHHFFVMQYVDGESLAERLGRQGRFPMDEALQLVDQCLAGLQAAHARGLIHRDIKPGNILLERESGRAMLVDFGLVRRLDDSDRMTATGVIMGTVDYISPEQARGRKVDARADIYSLGVLLYQLLAGRMPFTADSPTAMIFQHAYEKPFPLEQAADVPPTVVAIVTRMMAKDPDDRYADCAAVAADIQAFRSGRPLPSPPGRDAGREGGTDIILPSPFGRGAGGEGGADDSGPLLEPSFVTSDKPWQARETGRRRSSAVTPRSSFRNCNPPRSRRMPRWPTISAVAIGWRRCWTKPAVSRRI